MIGLVHFAAEWWYTLERNNHHAVNLWIFWIERNG